MAQRIVGLDLGSYSIKVVHVQARGRTGDFEVVAYDEALVPPPFEIDDGQPATLQERQAVALKELFDKGALRGDVFITGLPGDAAAVRTLKFPFADSRKIQQTLPFELESELPFDLEDVVISWSVLRQLPSAAGGNETEVLAAYARRDSVRELLALLEGVGIDPRHVEFDALTLDDLYDGLYKNQGPDELGAPLPRTTTPGGTVIEMGPDAPPPAIAMVDIGHRRTSVCILAEGRVVSAQTILFGGGDATQKLARELGLPHDEAERGKKKEAFIEVLGAVAQFPEQARVSDILKNAYGPIARRLRQVFQAAVSSQRVRVAKVVLTGGGSRVLNLDRYFAEVLNVRVVRAPEIAQLIGGALPLPEGVEVSLARPEAPQAGMVLGYALSGMRADKTRARIDFRTGEFAWKGELDFLRERAVPLFAWAVVLLMAVGLSGAARAFVLSSEEDDVRTKQLEACKAIIGKDVESTSVCEATIREKIGGQAGFALPEYSAVDHYLTVSKRLPPAGTMARKVTELDVNPERVRVQAIVPDFDAVDKVVNGLTGGRCFESIEKGKARNVKDGVELNLLVRVDCEKAPGDAANDEPAAEPEKAGRPDKADRAARRSPSPRERARERADAAAGDGEPGGAAPSDAPLVDGESDGKDAREERMKRLRERREAMRRAREEAGEAPTEGVDVSPTGRPDFGRLPPLSATPPQGRPLGRPPRAVDEGGAESDVPLRDPASPSDATGEE